MSHWVRTVLEDAIETHNRIPEHAREGLRRIVEIIEHSDVVQFRTPEFEAIADELSCCADLRSLSLLLWKAATSAGFQNFCLFVISQGGERGFETRLCTSYSDTWLTRYATQSYHVVDPVIARARERDGCFLYSDCSSSSPVTEAFWDDAEKFRAGRSGFCFSSTRPSGARLGVTFSTNDTDARSAELFRLNGHDLTVIAQLAIECFCYLSSGDGLSEEPLSMEELRFLHTLATSPNPEKALTISSNYGGNKSLQDSIRKKLNVSTVFQAISIASSMRWFDMLPFSSEDAVRPFPGLTGWELAEDEEVSL